jgi:prepilin-type processing-associated H-X9-DG protein
VDIPASYHGGSGGLSFADGHCELKRWQDARTKPPLVKSVIIPYDRPSPDNVDIAWLQERATRRK